MILKWHWEKGELYTTKHSNYGLFKIKAKFGCDAKKKRCTSKIHAWNTGGPPSAPCYMGTMVSFRPLRMGLFYDPFQMAPNSTAEIHGVIRSTYPSPGMICQLGWFPPTRVRHFVWVFWWLYRRFNKLETYGTEKHPRLLLQSSKIHCSLFLIQRKDKF